MAFVAVEKSGPCKHGVIDDVCIPCSMEAMSTTGPDTRVLVHWESVPDDVCMKDTKLEQIVDQVSSSRTLSNCVACLAWHG